MPVPTPRKLAVLAPLCAMLALGVVLSACGSSSPSASGTTTTTTSSSSSSISSLGSLASTAQTSTYQAVYSYQSGGTTHTVTYSQSPPKFSFLQSGGSLVLNDGTNSYYCGTDKKCVSTTSGNPLEGLVGLFNGKTFQATATAYSVASAILSRLGVSLSYTTSSYGGQPSNCVTVSKSSQTATWCVTTGGVLSYWSGGGSTFTLTSYTSSPPASAFTLPAGYTTVTIPSAG